MFPSRLIFFSNPSITFFFRYAKDIILVIVITQTTSLIHRYFWWLLLVVWIDLKWFLRMIFFRRFHRMRFIKELSCSSFHLLLNYVPEQIKNKTLMRRIKNQKKVFGSFVASQKNSFCCCSFYLSDMNKQISSYSRLNNGSCKCHLSTHFNTFYFI